ncbi:Hypothetical predicted protein, partial [Paramuricea clavata]
NEICSAAAASKTILEYIYCRGRKIYFWHVIGNQLRLTQPGPSPDKDALKEHGEVFETKGWIQKAIYAGEPVANIKTKKEHYDECWREFVSKHEQYMELLVSEEEKDIASRSYKELMTKKMHLDEIVMSLRRRLELESRQKEEDASSFSGKSRRTLASKSSHSSKFSTVSKRKEQLALAQLKRSQLLKQHELERRMTELNFEKEYMEARMEEERAIHENVNKNTLPMNQGQGLSPLSQPYVPQEQIVQGTNISSPQVCKVYSPERHAEQYNVPLQLTQTYPQQEQPNRFTRREGPTKHTVKEIDTGEEMVRALRQVVSMPKIKYMHFDAEEGYTTAKKTLHLEVADRTLRNFLHFVKKRATLVNNEFGEDLCASLVKPKENVRRKDGSREPSRRSSSFASGLDNRQSHKNGKGCREQEVKVTVATGAGERVCLSVVPLKVRAKGSNQPAIGAYVLLDSGSEVTLCHERLKKQLAVSGRKLDFTLSGMTGSTKVRSELIDIEVASLDGEILIELSNVRTVNQMPISEACIAKKGDVRSWSHLRDLPLQELETRDVMLVIGLQENPSMFLPLEYRSGEERDPVAIRYSLGWTVIGPVGEKMDGMCATSNFARMSVNADDLSTEDRDRAMEESEHVMKGRTEEVKEVERVQVDRENTDEDLKHQLERLWKTDFEGSLVETKVCPSVEDKKALQIMEKTLKIVDGHFQVALPWKNNPPYLPNNKIVAERRGLLLKKRLLRDDELLKKYRTTFNEYLEKGYAEKIPKEQLNMENRPIWYVPHHPVTHPLKPEKVRVVYDCAASYGRTSLNQQLLQGPDQTNQLTGVLIRFREESVAMVANVEAMFHQVLVEPRDCDALRFLWWPSDDLSGEMEEYRMTRHLFGATDERAKSVKDLELDRLPTESALGIKWNTEEDKFEWHVSEKMLQCYLQAIRVDRCFKPVGFGVVKEIQLHLFSDASRLGYSAVAYLRLEDTNEQIHCAFVMGKARLAPLREISIPRLELTAAVISVRLSKIIQEELDLEIERIYYWTDSMSVLKCINNESKRFHTFESNRLTVIRSGSDPSQWMYVNRDDNPADDGSKGVKLDAMISNDRKIMSSSQEELKILTVAERAKKPDKVFLRKTGMSLRQLNPQLEDGLLRVGGRLVNAPIDGDLKHPIILPFKHPVTEMVIRQYHAEVGHMGQESVLSSLRKEFWIVKGRTAVRRVVRSCISCQRRKARLGEQFMANLPKIRLTPHQPPFTRVGVDYFGPLQVKQGRSVVKRYGCLFTCMTTRAVHIEIAHSLDTDSMINALRRFISIR